MAEDPDDTPVEKNIKYFFQKFFQKFRVVLGDVAYVHD